MNVHEVLTLFAYNGWANRRILAAASRLSAADFARDLGASFGSVRGTLAHTLWGEQRWFRFWQDGSFIPDVNLDDFPDTESVANAWTILDQERDAFAVNLTESRLEVRLTVRDQDFTLGELIHHIMNHSTYHRGQVVLMLRLLGETPPATDFRLFLGQSR